MHEILYHQPVSFPLSLNLSCNLNYLYPNFISCRSNIGQSNYIETFFIQLSVVFAADEYRFSSDEMKVLYTIGCLSGNALSYVQPFLKNIDSNNPNDKHEILKDFNIFTKFLFDAFGDSNPVVNSENAIRNLKQTGSATEFRRLSMQLTWNNDALVQYLSMF